MHFFIDRLIGFPWLFPEKNLIKLCISV